jgi:cytochrome c
MRRHAHWRRRFAHGRRLALLVLALAACTASPKPITPATSALPAKRTLAPSAAGSPAGSPDSGVLLRIDRVGTSPRLGRHATAAEIAALDIDVGPDGSGLPPGSGSVAEGAVIYAARCAHCHGADGEGGPADRLVGGVGSLAGAKPVLTTGSFWPYATTLFDYLRRAMPYDAPGTLADADLYALTAFLLERSGIVAAETRLDAATLPAVRMPNRDGFESAWPPPAR